MKANQKVQIVMRDEVVSEGILIEKVKAPFTVREGNFVVKTTKVFHPIAKKGIGQFSPEYVKFL